MHSHDLEKQAAAQLGSLQYVRMDFHFSGLPTGTTIFFFYLSILFLLSVAASESQRGRFGVVFDLRYAFLLHFWCIAGLVYPSTPDAESRNVSSFPRTPGSGR